MNSVYLLFLVLAASLSNANLSNVRGAPKDAYNKGASLAAAAQKTALASGTLLEGTAKDVIGNEYPSNPSETQSALSTDTKSERVKQYRYDMTTVVKGQLQRDRVRIDPTTDPIFINGNKALSDPLKTLEKQTVTYLEDKDYEDVSCIETRDEEFDSVNTARIDPSYKRFEVSMFFNHCPNHRGWGKQIAKGCQTWNKPELMHPARNIDADYEEIHGMEWQIDKHPNSDALLAAGKCRLKKEMPQEEGRASRMIPVAFYKKEETRTDWHITKIEDYREGRARFRGPADFGVESFVKVQIYTCSYKTSGNTCEAIRARGGIEKVGAAGQKNTCLEKVGDVCVKWQKIYNVPKEGAILKTRTTNVSGEHEKPFNLDGAMADKSYAENTESVDVIAKLTAVKETGAAMQKFETGDLNALAVFKGEDLRCAMQGGKWSHHGCPGQRGKKTPDEQKLEHLEQQGKCIVVGRYEEKGKNIGTAIGQKRTVTSYCCFESILAKVLHQGAIDQGIKELGEAKAPNCAALTLGQMQTLAWDKVNFAPFVADMTSRVNLTPGHIAQQSATTVQSHLSTQLTAAQQAHLREQVQAQAQTARAQQNGGHP